MQMVPNSLVALGGRFLEPSVPGSKMKLRVVSSYHYSVVGSGGVLLGRKKLAFLQLPVLPEIFGLLKWS